MNQGLLGMPRGTTRRLRRPSLYQKIHVEEQQPFQTQAGSIAAATTWLTRTLNTIVCDDTGSARFVGTSQLLIPAGKYQATAGVMSMYETRTRGRIRDITNGVTLAEGLCLHTGQDMATVAHMPLYGPFEATRDIVIELQQWCQTDPNQTWDLGHYGAWIAADPEIEKYGYVELIRVRT